MATNNFITNTASLKATTADIRKLDVKKINAQTIFLDGENIRDVIDNAIPTIKHANDTRENVYENDLWGQWVETTDDGTIVVHDDYLNNPNGGSAWLSNVKAVQDNKAYSEIITDSDGKFTGVVEDSVLANIQIERIKDGDSMFS